MSRTFSNNPATSANHVRATHINELHSAVNRDRATAGLSAFNWSDGAVVGVNSHIRAVHFTETRSAIQDLWTYANMNGIPNWSVGAPPSASRQVSARDINDLRNWVNQYEDQRQYGDLSIYWLGCDSNSNVFPCGSADFYIGEIGKATTPTYDTFAFNKAAATRVGPHGTYGYWFMNGPDAAPPGTDPYTWGQQQAGQALNAWSGTSEIATFTIFGDVETDSTSDYGWGTNQQANQQVWLGFSDLLLVDLNTAGLYVGHQSNWNSIMGASYTINSGIWVWSADNNLANCSTDSYHNPVPANCPTAFPSLPAIGGVAPSLWQFNVTGGVGCADDVDMALFLPQ